MSSNGETVAKIYVILEAASLEIWGSNALMNCDDHPKSGARPDITHSCLLSLLDSPLNKAGMLQIYIHTMRNVLICVNPSVRIPRTFKRFAGLMVQLLHKLSIRSAGGERLLRVVSNPVTDHLPPDCYKMALSYDAKVQKVSALMDRVAGGGKSVAIVVGAMAHGPDTFADGWIDEKVGISHYPLSASVACSKFIHGVEDYYGIL